jgi:hypothetical protein
MKPTCPHSEGAKHRDFRVSEKYRYFNGPLDCSSTMWKVSSVWLLCIFPAKSFQPMQQTPSSFGIGKDFHTGSHHDHRSVQRATATKAAAVTRKNVLQLNADGGSPQQLVQRLKKTLSEKTHRPGLDASFVHQLDRSVVSDSPTA